MSAIGRRDVINLWTTQAYDKKCTSPDEEENSVVTQSIRSGLDKEEDYEDIIGVAQISHGETAEINSGPHTSDEVQEVVNLYDPARQIELIQHAQDKVIDDLSSDPSWVTTLPVAAAVGFYFGGPFGALSASVGLCTMKIFRAGQAANREIIEKTAPDIIKQLKELAVQLKYNGIIPVTEKQANANLENLSIQGKCTKRILDAHKLYTDLLRKQPLRII